MVQPSLGPTQQYVADMADCMRAAGWEVTIEPDGRGFSIDGTPTNRSMIDASEARCRARITQPPQPTLSEAFLHQRYQYLLTVRDCLMGLGYPMGSPQPEGLFIRSTGEWSPYTDLPEMGQAEWERVNAACPQTEPGT